MIRTSLHYSFDSRGEIKTLYLWMESLESRCLGSRVERKDSFLWFRLAYFKEGFFLYLWNNYDGA